MLVFIAAIKKKSVASSHNVKNKIDFLRRTFNEENVASVWRKVCLILS